MNVSVQIVRIENLVYEQEFHDNPRDVATRRTEDDAGVIRMDVSQPQEVIVVSHDDTAIRNSVMDVCGIGLAAQSSFSCGQDIGSGPFQGSRNRVRHVLIELKADLAHVVARWRSSFSCS